MIWNVWYRKCKNVKNPRCLSGTKYLKKFDYMTEKFIGEIESANYRSALFLARKKFKSQEFKIGNIFVNKRVEMNE